MGWAAKGGASEDGLSWVVLACNGGREADHLRPADDVQGAVLSTVVVIVRACALWVRHDHPFEMTQGSPCLPTDTSHPTPALWMRSLGGVRIHGECSIARFPTQTDLVPRARTGLSSRRVHNMTAVCATSVLADLVALQSAGYRGGEGWRARARPRISSVSGMPLVESSPAL